MSLARSIGKMIIERLATEGLGSNQIIKYAQSVGGGYRRTDMLNDIRVATGRFKNEYFVNNLGSNEVVPTGLMIENDLSYDASYRVYGRYVYYDEFQDEYFEETKSFYTDDLANKGKWSDDFYATYGEKYEFLGQMFMSFEITAVEHNIGYSY